MNFETLRTPVEVFRAAIGDPGPLVERLMGEAAIFETERTALALLVAGKLKKPKRRPPAPESILARLRLLEASKFHPDGHVVPSDMKARVKNAVARYHYIMSRLRAERKAWGQSEAVIDYVAEYDALSPFTVRDAVRRSKVKMKRPPLDAKTKPHAEAMKDMCLADFRTWCRLNWELVQQISRPNLAD